MPCAVRREQQRKGRAAEHPSLEGIRCRAHVHQERNGDRQRQQQVREARLAPVDEGQAACGNERGIEAERVLEVVIALPSAVPDEGGGDGDDGVRRAAERVGDRRRAEAPGEEPVIVVALDVEDLRHEADVRAEDERAQDHQRMAELRLAPAHAPEPVAASVRADHGRKKKGDLGRFGNEGPVRRDEADDAPGDQQRADRVDHRHQQRRPLRCELAQGVAPLQRFGLVVADDPLRAPEAQLLLKRAAKTACRLPFRPHNPPSHAEPVQRN